MRGGLLFAVVAGCLGADQIEDPEGCRGTRSDGTAFTLEHGDFVCDGATKLECHDGFVASSAGAECGGGDADSDTDTDTDTASDDGFNDEDPFEVTVLAPGTLSGETIATGETLRYRLDLVQGQHAMFEVLFRDADGDIDVALLGDDAAVLQRAESPTDDERISAWNPLRNETFYLEVFLYSGGAQTFDVNVVLRSLTNEIAVCTDDDCDDLMQLPAKVADELGFFPDERPAYHFMRKDLLQAFVYATRQVALDVPDTGPLGVAQVGDSEGRIPGLKEGDQWHPTGTHTAGFDMDTAYYRTDGPNEAGYVCVDEICEVTADGGCYASGGRTIDYFCDSTSDHWMDAERMALYYGHLLESRIVRVIGADRILVDDVFRAANDLVDAGRMDAAIRNELFTRLACEGTYDQCFAAGWAFHVHHTHVSTIR